MQSLQAVKGMNDLFEDELATWRHVEETARATFKLYGCEEIRTPVLEDLNVFVRGVGEHTDVVEKEMYVLEDRDGKALCLRPEGTAGVVRALVEHSKLGPQSEGKYYYIGPMFRRERPQKGRLRQFHQVSIESFGVAQPQMDVEVLALLHQFFHKLGLTDLRLCINTLGNPDERQDYVLALRGYFEGVSEQLCADCKRRLMHNTLRILDCKNPQCIALVRQAPVIWGFLSGETQAHFEAVKSGLEALKIPFVETPRLVRGLDYYTRTVFELVADAGLGSQNTVAAGGRYDNLTETLGGPKTPAIGFSAGIERIVLLLQEKNLVAQRARPELAIIYADEVGQKAALGLTSELRNLGLYVEIDLQARSVKAQMRRADRLKAKAVVVLGEREIAERKTNIKLLDTGETSPLDLDAGAIMRFLWPTK